MASDEGVSVASLKQKILDNLELALARQPRYATQRDWYTAVALTVRGLMVSNWYRGTNIRSDDHQRVVAISRRNFSSDLTFATIS
jgi:glucan phosphorylase